MSKKILDILVGIGIVVAFIGFVFITNSTSNTNSKITLIPRYPTQDTDYHVEVLGIIYPKNDEFKLSKKNELYKQSVDDANFQIMNDLYGGKKYIAPTRVELTGEIKNGKTYFYYTGYVTTFEGEYQDFNETIICDFVLDSNAFDFKLLSPIQK